MNAAFRATSQFSGSPGHSSPLLSPRRRKTLPPETATRALTLAGSPIFLGHRPLTLGQR
jgi:hypothetical protein